MSKFLSRHLRHRPGDIGLTLDAGGWVDVDEVLAACGRHGIVLTRDELEHVVASSDKQRFALDGNRIRANQGHTVRVALGLTVQRPPEVLYHGTVAANLDAIRADGLKPMGRHDVHLSSDVDTARRVGSRRGKPVVLTVQAEAMHQAGHEFRLSDNGVWLVAEVPPRFLQ
ncbi:putative RNA 2'-phosphotransferase [Kibdelosporangium banguiense]|uniref:Probable RNA 2'-phosphotransferase n=1 Tax=Kibdelosporangium banguiense TaxID=1365924 RepID=A0ABS4TDA0_9PSEU|nr:RNA 2'-phosphotransferase [Kibdelosporangium banguiense]MBP2321833.1 putative RNA 2'-phosphotransferase [Kibdelosporangium banguiense]